MITDGKRRSVLFFDGVCNLCNYAVQFVMKNDKYKHIYFSTLQSSSGQSVLKQFSSNNKYIPNSLILFHNGKYYVKSDAALHTGMQLTFFIKCLSYIGWLVPKPFRDAIYDIIAQKRYKWYGKMDTCMVPSADLQDRFLSE
ncbi:MAG: DCC1-like thiol-disulfide oxidoreductase family protein [Bacteroidota bacterium]